MSIVTVPAKMRSLAYLNSASFWNKKVKIALLALATFIAMC